MITPYRAQGVFLLQCYIVTCNTQMCDSLNGFWLAYVPNFFGLSNHCHVHLNYYFNAIDVTKFANKCFCHCRHCFSGLYPECKNFWQNDRINLYFSISRSIFLVAFVLNSKLNTRVCSTTVTTAPMKRYTRINKITYKKAKMAIHGVMAVIISFHTNVFQRLVTLHNTKVGKFICTKIMDFDLIFFVLFHLVRFQASWFDSLSVVGTDIEFFHFCHNLKGTSFTACSASQLKWYVTGEKILWWVFFHIFSCFYCAFCMRAFRKIQE